MGVLWVLPAEGDRSNQAQTRMAAHEPGKQGGLQSFAGRLEAEGNRMLLCGTSAPHEVITTQSDGCHRHMPTEWYRSLSKRRV